MAEERRRKESESKWCVSSSKEPPPHLIEFSEDKVDKATEDDEINLILWYRGNIVWTFKEGDWSWIDSPDPSVGRIYPSRGPKSM